MISSKVRAALELRKKMKEHRKLKKDMKEDYREMDLKYEELIQSFDDDEQLKFVEELTKELK